MINRSSWSNRRSYKLLLKTGITDIKGSYNFQSYQSANLTPNKFVGTLSKFPPHWLHYFVTGMLYISLGKVSNFSLLNFPSHRLPWKLVKLFKYICHKFYALIITARYNVRKTWSNERPLINSIKSGNCNYLIIYCKSWKYPSL